MPAPHTDGLVDAVVQTSFVTTAVLARIGAENNLSLPLIRVLGILRDRQPKVSALAEHLGVERSSLSGLLDRAEARGLLTRVRDPSDGRAANVVLSPAGAELADRLYTVVEDALAPMTDQLTAADRSRLQRLLERLLTATTG